MFIELEKNRKWHGCDRCKNPGSTYGFVYMSDAFIKGQCILYFCENCLPKLLHWTEKEKAKEHWPTVY